MASLIDFSFDIGSSAGSVLNALGGLLSYSQQKKLMKDQYGYNLALQQQAQDWQAGMSNTAFQRQVSDLRSAGLNPLLATGMSGSSTGSVGAGSVSGASAPGYDFTGGMNTASETKRRNSLLSHEIDNLVSQTAANSAASALTLQQALTEESKRINMEFDNAMKDSLRHKTDKEISWIDREKNAEIYKATQDAELARAKASLEAYNSETNRISANAAKTTAEVTKDWTPAKIGSGIGLGALGILSSRFPVSKFGKYGGAVLRHGRRFLGK